MLTRPCITASVRCVQGRGGGRTGPHASAVARDGLANKTFVVLQIIECERGHASLGPSPAFSPTRSASELMMHRVVLESRRSLRRRLPPS